MPDPFYVRVKCKACGEQKRRYVNDEVGREHARKARDKHEQSFGHLEQTQVFLIGEYAESRTPLDGGRQ